MQYENDLSDAGENEKMRMIENFNLQQVPIHKITLLLTSTKDYEMERIIYVEDFPDYNDHTFLKGSHCSCFDFYSARWEATIVTKEELVKLLEGWIYGLELRMAQEITKYLGRWG